MERIVAAKVECIESPADFALRQLWHALMEARIVAVARRERSR